MSRPTTPASGTAAPVPTPTSSAVTSQGRATSSRVTRANGIVIGLRGGGSLSGNRVQGNLVGLAADGTTLVPNGPAAGILVAGAFVGAGAASQHPHRRHHATGAKRRGGNGQGRTSASGSRRATSMRKTRVARSSRATTSGLDRSGTLARGFTTGINVGGTGTLSAARRPGARNVVAGNVSHNILSSRMATTVQGNLHRHQRGGHRRRSGRARRIGILVKAPNTVVGGTTPRRAT